MIRIPHPPPTNVSRLAPPKNIYVNESCSATLKLKKRKNVEDITFIMG